ncbi:trigger factor [Anaerosalibacter bizertensis]|uniref:Trigger factor n=1 Tax=Anaerosalibacter bizertensis TaxID=932217 RepID=A0A9Q4ABP7_9FIRM|nr:trigger factor [Anaerosalibacter bizertensis]MBV1818245.1 trigger factor [Bacteroidales bacterium MSK.15.36]MCB5559396.1 trigger factor [Anaerosalibacter bizertensis]MCG4564573.1 trigger factor [Anaerosalibacter bizertensis]MCG4583454.1 trigger factor [Anaerosalibacter bizertensis]
MNAVLEKKENNKATFTIEIGEDKFEKAIQKSYLKNRNRFNIPGFRKGKAPRKIIEMNYGEEIFYEEALNIILPEAYESAIDELELEPVEQPQVDIEELEKGKPVVFKIEVTVKPEVKLGEYKSIEVEKVEYNVKDEDVEKELNSIQEMNARLIDASDREIKDGDILNIDFEGYIDEEKFEGGTAENQQLEIGSNKFIPGFEEQLIGKKKGEEVEVKVNFPEDYFEESLKGKEAIFKVTINEIKEKELPELDDEFAKDVSEFDTLDEFKESIKEKLEEDMKNKEKVEQEGKVIDKVVEMSEVDIPEVMVDNQIQNEMGQLDYSLRMQGLSIDQYFELTNTDIEDFKEQIKPEAEKRVKTELVLEEIAKVEKIEVENEDIDKELEKMAEQYQTEDVEKFKEDMKKGDLEYIKTGIIRDKTIELLMANAKFI